MAGRCGSHRKHIRSIKMSLIRVWTKQNEAVLHQLEEKGRFIAEESFIRKEIGDTADIMLPIYKWLAENAPYSIEKPKDALYPVWVSLEKEATMIPESGYVILEMEIESGSITLIDTAKWTCITNYAYLAKDDADKKAHAEKLDAIGCMDAEAILTNFYPKLRTEIIGSWSRLFDESISLGSDTVYGIIWEVREEWIQKITE